MTTYFIKIALSALLLHSLTACQPMVLVPAPLHTDTRFLVAKNPEKGVVYWEYRGEEGGQYTPSAVASSSDTTSRLLSASAPHLATYVVQAGDNLYRISKMVGYPMAEIAAWNGLAHHILSVGQVLAVSPPPAYQYRYHTVQAGEDVYSIANRYASQLTFNDLIQWNDLISPYTVYAGQPLTVYPPLVALAVVNRPATMTVKPLSSTSQNTVLKRKTVAKPAAKGVMRHTVRRGETLESIARRYGTTISQLRRLNKLASDRVKIGQALRVL